MPRGSARPTCSVDGCDRPHASRGWCATHYYRWKRAGDLDPARPFRVYGDGTALCSVIGCGRLARAHALCFSHLARLKRVGDLHAETPIGVGSKYAFIPDQNCSVDGCSGAMVKKGDGKRLVLCRMHLARWRKHGDIAHERRGENTWNWKGGRQRGSNGYILRLVPVSHPMYSTLKPYLSDGAMREHRLVMAESLGRALFEWETVHHKNGIRDDNRLENLQLRAGPHGQGQIAYCGNCGSHDIRHAALP